MDAFEIQGLASWFKSYFKDIRQRMDALHAILSNNASQQAQQPVEDALNSLTDLLKHVRLEELNLQQLQLLERMEVADILGPQGAANIASLVRTASYDPASVEQKINARITRINQASQKLTAVAASLDELGFVPEEYDDEDGRITVRVIFRRDASIDNVADWKASAESWYQIIRGLAMALGEAPEDTKVMGASKGSLILVLSTTCTLTAALLVITKHVTGMAKEVISVQSAMEDLRQKKLMTETMKLELDKLVAKKREEGIAAIEADLANMIPGLKGEKKNSLDRSIEKLLDFSEKGGDLDFVEPPIGDDQQVEEDAGKEQSPMSVQMAEARRLIQEYQEERESLKQLEHHQPKDS